MTQIKSDDLYPVIDATWPAAEVIDQGPVTLRRGLGGGSRVSAATVEGVAWPDDLHRAEETMDEMGQPRLFMIQDSQDPLDQLLQTKGYAVMDPVWLYAAPVENIATERPPPTTSFEVWPPLALQAEIWAAGGIGAERLAIMRRVTVPKISLFGRISDKPAGTGFVAVHDGIAMLHALEVATDYRRQGLARYMTRAAAFWALEQGATHLSILTTQANVEANALYASLGMEIVGQYHYRIQQAKGTV